MGALKRLARRRLQKALEQQREDLRRAWLLKYSPYAKHAQDLAKRSTERVIRWNHILNRLEGRS